MRLWHVDLIPHLPRQQLLGQHRECCALRGNGWGKKHKTVDYVFQYHPFMLIDYHQLVIKEMRRRGYKVDNSWTGTWYRGKQCDYLKYDPNNCWYVTINEIKYKPDDYLKRYPEHNPDYLQSCIENLRQKGVVIDVSAVSA